MRHEHCSNSVCLFSQQLKPTKLCAASAITTRFAFLFLRQFNRENVFRPFNLYPSSYYSVLVCKEYQKRCVLWLVHHCYVCLFVFLFVAFEHRFVYCRNTAQKCSVHDEQVSHKLFSADRQFRWYCILNIVNFERIFSAHY